MGELKEKKTIEFKQEFTPSFLKTVSAFANYGDGEIIFGISDDGELVGIKNIDQLKLAIENAINDTIEPRPIYTLKETIMDNKEVLTLNVYEQLIIHSQGGLPDGVTKDDYLNKNISIPRNSILADVFHRLKLIERFGTGVRRIRQAYSEFKEKPLFDFSEQSISVILPCVKYGDTLNLDIEGAHISDDEKVMKLIRSEKLITRKAVQEITGLGETQSKALLNRLIDSGFIRRVGKGRMTAYERIEA
ncbi:RNA-binding domain-containing protein [Acetobacterium malicum]|nr:RNA-binding domain-containing protein [Acetobacterium malicum]